MCAQCGCVTGERVYSVWECDWCKGVLSVDVISVVV